MIVSIFKEEHHESYDPKKYCEVSNVLINFQEMTKSQREAAREERNKLLMERDKNLKRKRSKN
jgi:hypothetical protein